MELPASRRLQSVRWSVPAQFQDITHQNFWTRHCFGIDQLTNQLVASYLGFYVVFCCFYFVLFCFFAFHTGWLSSLWGITQCIGKYSIININRRGWAQMEEHWSVCRGFNFLAKPRATVLKITSKIVLAVIFPVPGVQIMENGPK